MTAAASTVEAASARPRAVLAGACAAHLVQDGLVSLQFVLLPVLSTALGLSYAQVGLLKMIADGALAAMEVPSGLLAEKLGERRLLAAGLVGAGLGYLGISLADGFAMVAVCFGIAGMAAGFQHSLSSTVLVRSFDGGSRRRALGTYNASGDAGKLSYTALFGLGVGAGFGWSAVVAVLALVAVLAGVGVWRALRGTGSSSLPPADVRGEATAGSTRPSGWGIRHRGRFTALLMAILLDSTVQGVFLTFIAFMAMEKGLGASTAASAVVLTLIGGMVGKFVCGRLAARMGDRATFMMLQVLTAIGIVLVVVVPGWLLLVLLPPIGLAVQGSSTVTYGAVGDHAVEGRQARVYALVYTLANGASLAALGMGVAADTFGLGPSFASLAVLALLSLPFAHVLSGRESLSTTSPPVSSY